MKKLLNLTTLAFILVMFAGLSCYSQDNEIPITSKSKEAIKLLKEGRAHIEDFEPQLATKKFDEALKLDPDLALAYLYKGVSAGNFDERVKNFNEALKRKDLVSEGERNLILFNDAYYNSKETDMWRYAEKLLIQYPNDRRLNQAIGTLYYQLGNYDEAINYYKKVLEIDSKFAPAYNMLGYTFSKLENFAEAEKNYKKYIELTPDKAGPYDSYADFLLFQDKYDDAIAYFKLSLEKENPSYTSLGRIGNIYTIKQNYEEARKYFNKYYEKETILNRKFNALFNIANTYLYQGNKDLAIKTYDDYLSLAKENNSLYYQIQGLINIGYIYTCCGNPTKGLEILDQANSLIENSEFDEVQKNNLLVTDAFYISLAYVEKEEFENAEKGIERCANLASEFNNSVLDKYINLLDAYKDIKQGNAEMAIAKLNELELDDPLYYYYSGLAYEMYGDLEKANERYGQFMNNKDGSMVLALYYNEVKSKYIE